MGGGKEGGKQQRSLELKVCCCSFILRLKELPEMSEMSPLKKRSRNDDNAE